MNGTSKWVIEACESNVRHPDYLVGASAGRCFFLWSDEFANAKKFNSEQDALKWTKDNRLNCGFRIRIQESSQNN